MMRECPCSTKTREGLENPSPPPSRFPLAMGFAPLDPRDFPRASPSGNPSGLGVQNPWPREISQDFPRPSRFPSGFALGKSLGSREILGVGDGFSNPSLLLVEHGYIPHYESLTVFFAVKGFGVIGGGAVLFAASGLAGSAVLPLLGEGASPHIQFCNIN